MSLKDELAPDVLRRVEAEAARRGMTVDALAAEMVAEMSARLPATPPQTPGRAEPTGEFFGFVPFPKRGTPITNEIIDQLRDELIA
ncbi:MAG TPA: hypothetical protein VNQ73_16630 [Ilumatobacter sp.]|nr:hypothetical protein [Ilumatobacter sp.]